MLTSLDAGLSARLQDSQTTTRHSHSATPGRAPREEPFNASMERSNERVRQRPWAGASPGQRLHRVCDRLSPGIAGVSVRLDILETLTRSEA